MTDLITRLAGSTGRIVTKAGGRAAVHLTRRFATDADDLWSAITEPERAARWLGAVSGDLREGGPVRLCMTPPDSDVAMLEILRCDRPHRLVARWQEENRPASIVTADLVPVHDGCELRLEHVAIDDTADYGCGWEDFLLRLDQLISGQEPHSPSWAEVKAALGPAWSAEVDRAADHGRWPVVDGGTIRAQHTVAAEPATVWAALTDPAMLARWFATVTGELTPGGAWLAMFDEGGCRGTIRDCDTGASFSTTWHWDHEPAEAVGLVSVRLAPGDAGTRIELLHEHAGPSAVGYAAGWYAHLRGLGASLAGRQRDERDWKADWATAMIVLAS